VSKTRVVKSYPPTPPKETTVRQPLPFSCSLSHVRMNKSAHCAYLHNRITCHHVTKKNVICKCGHGNRDWALHTAVRDQFLFSLCGQQPNAGQSHLILKVSRSRMTRHSETPLDEGSARRRDLYLTTHNHVPSGTFLCVLLYSVFHPYLCLCLDCSAFCLFVFTYNTTQTSMSPAGLEHAIPASERPQTARPLASAEVPIITTQSCPRFQSLYREMHPGPSKHQAAVLPTWAQH
jgi:hypothetical protein